MAPNVHKNQNDYMSNKNVKIMVNIIFDLLTEILLVNRPKIKLNAKNSPNIHIGSWVKLGAKSKIFLKEVQLASFHRGEINLLREVRLNFSENSK